MQTPEEYLAATNTPPGASDCPSNRDRPVPTDRQRTWSQVAAREAHSGNDFMAGLAALLALPNEAEENRA